MGQKTLGVMLLAVLGLAVLPNLIFSITAPNDSVVNTWFRSDDSFYYFQVARNIVSGHDSSFDQITRTNGFQPLWMMVLIPVFRLSAVDLVLPLRITLVISSLFHFGAAAMLLLLIRRAGINIVAGMSALMLFLLSPLWNFYVANGSEMAANLFTVSLFVYLLVTTLEKGPDTSWKRLSMLGAVAALVVLARLDNVFLVGLVTAYMCWWLLGRQGGAWRRRMGLLLHFLAPLVLIVSSYLLFNQLYYGGLFPVSGQIKMYWYSIGGSVFGPPPEAGLEALRALFGPSTHRIMSGPTENIFTFLSLDSRAYIIFGAGGVLLVLGLLQSRAGFRSVLALLFIASVLHTGFFGVVGYIEPAPWYWVTEYVTVMLLAALAFQGIFTIVRGTRGYWLASVLIPIFVLLFLGPGYLKDVTQDFDFSLSKTPRYIEYAELLEKSTPENAIIGTPNAGGVGYFTNRRVVNIDGLSNSNDFLASLKEREGHQYLKQIGVEYIFRVEGYLKTEPYKHMLAGKLEKVGPDLYRYFPDR